MLIVGLISLLWATTARASSVEEISALEYFPLFKGSVWTYQGPAVWTVEDSGGEVRTEVLTIRMEVTETYRRGPLWLARLRGHPADAAWYHAGKVPSRGAYLAVGYQVYELDESRAEEVFRRLQDPMDSLIDLVREDELAFDFPLLPGKRFGERAQLGREDGAYQWVVPDQRGAITEGDLELRYETLPAHIRLHFRDGQGITRYEYVHHGTVSEARLTLVGFTAGVPPNSERPDHPTLDGS